MTRAIVSFFLALALGAPLATTLGASPASAGPGHPDMMLGPGEARVNGIGQEAVIRTSKWGYVYIAGKHHSHLTITHDKERNFLRYRDTTTKRVHKLPAGCRKKQVRRGISVACTIPPRFAHQKMFVQVWPRLGNDYVDARTLSARFRVWVLADAGRDVVYGGAGRDFVNGAKDGDRVYGGAGNDFLRTGPGNDMLRGGPGRDKLSCAENHDIAYRSPGDRLSKCESVRRG